MKNIKPYIVFMLACFLTIGCTKDDNESGGTGGGTDDDGPVGETFNGPKYADNYTAISGWENRNQWNLANVHDPTIVKDGQYFYMYQTDASYGNASFGHGHFHARRSLDLINWEYLGAAMTGEANWVKDEINTRRAIEGRAPIQNITYGYWAPCVRKVGNKFRMYYSVINDALVEGTDPARSWGEEAYIGMMETTSLASNQWEDKGMVICNISDGVTSHVRNGANDWNAYYKFNSIDPSYIATPEGEHWLIYGSWHTGIAAVKINPETGRPYQLNTIDDYGVRISGRGNISTNRWQALEGPEIVYNAQTGYYYLFLAYDELSVAYNTRVARSRNITGPYVGKNGQSITEGADAWPMLTHPYAFNNHTGWVGISHCGVIQDEANGKWYFTSQGRLPENVPGINASNAVMMGQVREMDWTSDGWPVVAPERYAGVPAATLTDASFVGAWEIINMNYQYKVIQKSVTVSLNANGTVGDGMTGTWSYDSAKNAVIINGIECKIFNGWDWEASPRKVALTISGSATDGKPLWGKKIY
ncbi:arabinan endo-1,5-alpha-L-arabinosidase [Flavobacterium psychrotrophum]|uniref:arabinan endo-1,5-alpha-L-arabinosidase n=1 Tax=Flavobacterium psychrotrophum TaxID=2294119 RepID=UPI000E30C651|nr:arabinan endo-1,5-alpha-L-arabinosidase [Flavobacterium psychrotrophum]